MPTDVLITGAGPVGLALANELMRFGLSVRIVDKSAARTDKSKALVVWPRTLELLDRSGLAAKLVAAGSPTRAAHLMSGGKELARVSFEGVESAYPYGLMLPQSETERLLEEHLTGTWGSVERNTELLSFADTGASVTAVLQTPAGTETVETAWLIACDGAHSTVRHQLGLSFEGDTLPQDWMLADVRLDGMPDPDDMHISLHREGALAIFSFGAGRARVIANTGLAKEGETTPAPTLADVQAVLDTRGPGGVTASDPVWIANFRINERKVTEYRVSRVFLAGDAAHIHSPAGGQGMNTGMQDAFNLAWKLALVHRGLMQPALLDSYTAERSPVAEQVLKSTGLLTKMGTLEGAGLQTVRNAAVSLLMGATTVRHAVAEQLTELAVGYPKSPLNFEKSPLHGPRAGERAPVRAGELFGAGNTPRFTLCAADDADAQQFLACFPELLEPQVRAPFVEGGFWVVRPDGYVAIAAAEGEWAAADEYFAKLAVWRTQAPAVERS